LTSGDVLVPFTPLLFKLGERFKNESQEEVMAEVIIRRMRVRDIEAILRIDEGITGRPHEAYWESKVVTYISRAPQACLVAELDEKVVGFILGDIRGWEFAMPLSGWLEVMGVDVNFRGQGIGKKLITALFAYFEKSDIETVQAMVNGSETDLLGYFESVGFERGEYVNLSKKLK
jgi:ribosomal protein S18 acetylase RimI-like enzyme